MYNLNIKEVLKTMTVTVLYSHNKLQKISIFLKLKILAEHVDAKDCLYNKKIDYTLLFKSLVRVFKFLE